MIVFTATFCIPGTYDCVEEKFRSTHSGVTLEMCEEQSEQLIENSRLMLMHENKEEYSEFKGYNCSKVTR